MKATNKSFFTRFENILVAGMLGVIVLLLLFEVVGRIVGIGIPSSSEYIRHLVLWVGFIGAMITTREKRHLSLSLGIDSIQEPYKQYIIS
jgi:TRAP-type C4-dicarboxylate transport system permease small subunit